MEFIRNGFIIIPKEPEEDGGYFADRYDGFTEDIANAMIFQSQTDVENELEHYDNPTDYIFKPIEIKYKIKNLKLL